MRRPLLLTGTDKKIEEMISKATAPVESKEKVAFPELRKLGSEWTFEFRA